MWKFSLCRARPHQADFNEHFSVLRAIFLYKVILFLFFFRWKCPPSLPSQACTSCCRICLTTAAVYENAGVGSGKVQSLGTWNMTGKTKCCQVHEENRIENKANIFSHLFKFYHSAVLFLVAVDITFCRKKFDISIQLAVLSFPVLIWHLASNPVLWWELCSRQDNWLPSLCISMFLSQR